MSHVFHRHCHTNLPHVSHGVGVYLYDNEGKQYLDGCGGAAVSNLGHSHPAIKEAIKHQLDTIPYAHTGFFTSDVCEELATLISDLAPASLNHVYFVSGGSEAVESALKMARQYFVEKGQTDKSQFIARRQSYHGNTLGALSVGGNEWRREPFRPLLNNAHHISPCYAYRDQAREETELDYSIRVANKLETTILEVGPENIMAFVAEPVVGATAGAVPATDGYFKRIRQICDKYDVLLILDEVMCGAGRTGTFFAFEQDDIIPDLVTMAKGLGAGYQPIGAVVASDEIYDTIANGSGFFQHGHTFMGHPMACASALATIKTIINDQLLAKVTDLGSKLKQKLEDALLPLPYVGDIRGRGLFLAIELVANKEDKSPLAVSTQANKTIKQAAMKNGLMCYPMAGTIDGKRGHHILIAPPFIIEETQLDELVDKLKLSLQEASSTWS
ncbi:aspartate aminotransferase family protein [Vibrio sp. VB16]|uniref:aspartate aminotransferase family protein n=1 Tax=Vibrio sp. VB16 TaxID=2785746 RepID=UPI00189CCF91|nr:aspartate aminotransferase family protein [Vibrio sp. VB16]UGA56116.1 aspartate aminotransferase family protein [Vibrio sp. VB16]